MTNVFLIVQFTIITIKKKEELVLMKIICYNTTTIFTKLSLKILKMSLILSSLIGMIMSKIYNVMKKKIVKLIKMIMINLMSI